MILPATWPSTPPPSQIIQRKRSMSFAMSALPQITSGIESRRPKITSPISPCGESLPSFAMPAMAMTLSRLMTTSAMMMILTACQSEDACRCAFSGCAAASSASSCGRTSFHATHSSRMPASNWRIGILVSHVIRKTNRTRKPTAPPAPKICPQKRCFAGSERVASAMTSALSPARTRSVRMI